MSKEAHNGAHEGVERAFRQALEAAGHRYTTQRAAVYDALYASFDHPTADEIFTSVRGRIPDISLATVYKALEAFVSSGLASKLTMADGPARYDGRMDAHDHIRCRTCGRVADIDVSSTPGWLESVSDRTDFVVLGYRLELVGTCPACQA